MSQHDRIDVHHHLIPPIIKQKAGLGWPIPDWTLEADKNNNKELGISVSILTATVPEPGIGKTLEENREIVRGANEECASVCKDNPNNYGFFAITPSPIEDMQGALDEVAHCFDQLHADGVSVLTSYDGYYLGHPDLTPLWEELNRRQAIVFVHPTAPKNWTPSVSTLMPPHVDYAFETTRAAMDLIMRRILRRFPNVKVLLSHAGGTLPFIWERTALLLESTGKSEVSYEEFKDDARSFYYDTALSGNPQVVDLLTKFAKPGHVLYGSDFPYVNEKGIRAFTERLDSADLSHEVRDMVDRQGALKLFPRFQKS